MRHVVAMMVLVGVVAGAEVAPPPDNAIVAIVDNEPVTKHDVDSLLREFYRDLGKIPPAEYRALWEKAREALIDHKLLIEEARRRKIAVSPEEVNAEIERLKQAGVNVERQRDVIRQRLMVSRLLMMLQTARAISPRELTDYYNKHRDDFVLPERRHVFLLAVYARAFGGEKAAARKKATEILEALRKGEDFATLAKRHSNGPFAEKGGDQGWLERGTLLPKLDAVVFRLKPGECSDLVETDDGYIILKVAGVQPASHQSLAEARPLIERRLREEARKKARERLLARLRKAASILRFDIVPTAQK